MATRTISNTGGNYNATASWVEGIVPTSADDVVATATSGQLTVNVASAASTFNFTNYTNTLTMNNTWTVSGTGTSTFVSAMTIAGGSNITLTGSGATIVTNGKSIPNLSFTGNKTIGDTLNVTNLTISNLTLSGTQTINVSGNLNGPTGFSVIGSGITLNMIGSGSISMLSSLLMININTSGSINFTNTQGIGLIAQSTYATTFKYTSGTITGTKRIVVSPATATTTTAVLDLSSSSGWEMNMRLPGNSTNTSTILQLNSDFNFDKFYFWSPASNQTVTHTFFITGTGALKGGKLILNPVIQTNQSTTSFLQYNNNVILKLGSTASHTVAQLESSGFDNDNNIISSQTASTTAYFGVTGTQSIQLTDFTDIDASSGPISVFRGTLTRTSGITNYTSYTGGGSGGGSWTFVN